MCPNGGTNICIYSEYNAGLFIYFIAVLLSYFIRLYNYTTHSPKLVGRIIRINDSNPNITKTERFAAVRFT